MSPPASNAAPKLQELAPVDEGSLCTRGAEHNQMQELYLRHSPGLVRQLTRATGCREMAGDLVQETFVRLMRMKPIELVRINHPEAFLRRISVNLLRDHGRGRIYAERLRKVLEVSRPPVVDQVATLESRETLRRVEAALAKLKPKTRQIFLAQRIEGLSYAEIAERTGLSVKGVEKQMTKAIAKIHHMLDRD